MSDIYRFSEFDRKAFIKEANVVAEFLLGKILCHKIGENTFRFLITETEAYGKDDPFCHAKNYKSGNGVEAQRMIGGTIYVHYRNNSEDGSMFDIVSGKAGEGEGVLMRAAVNIANPDICATKGPRLLGCAFKMTYDENNKKDLLNHESIWLEENKKIIVDKKCIIKKQRVGLSIPNNEPIDKRIQKEKHIGDKLNYSIKECEVIRILNALSKS